MPGPGKVEFSYRLLRVVAKALPPLTQLASLKKSGNLWRCSVLFVGPFAVAASSELMTVAIDTTRDNERTVIFFPRAVRTCFRQRGRIPPTATWSEGIWSVPEKFEVVGARKLNEFLAEEGGGLGAWAGWTWQEMLRNVAAAPTEPLPAFGITGQSLIRVTQAAADFADRPVGFVQRDGRVIVTYADPRVVSLLSPWRMPPELPEWVGGSDDSSPGD